VVRAHLIAGLVPVGVCLDDLRVQDVDLVFVARNSAVPLARGGRLGTQRRREPLDLQVGRRRRIGTVTA
jgi:hypothetical protein